MSEDERRKRNFFYRVLDKKSKNNCYEGKAWGCLDQQEKASQKVGELAEKNGMNEVK